LARDRTRNRPNATGRNGNRTGSEGAVIILRRSFWLSAQVSALSITARVLLVELTAMYTGSRCNVGLYLSVRDAARRLGLGSLESASAALQELINAGFLTETVAGHFNMKVGGKSKARAFRLNWKDDEGRPRSAEALPALDFRCLNEKQKLRLKRRSEALANYRKENLSVPESGTQTTIRGDLVRQSVRESDTLGRENRRFALPDRVPESGAHIYYQGGSGASVHKPATLLADGLKVTRARSLSEAMRSRHRPGRGRRFKTDRASRARPAAI